MAGALCVGYFFGCNSRRETKVKENERYLRALSATISAFHATNGKLPISIEEAQKATGTMLPNRGDAFGSTLIYYKVANSAFLLRSFGANDSDEHGGGDDVQISVVNGREVSRSELIRYVKSNYPSEWEAHVVVMGEDGQ
jgi:hypothetical protein